MPLAHPELRSVRQANTGGPEIFSHRPAIPVGTE
jgi:hypothetical protein